MYKFYLIILVSLSILNYSLNSEEDSTNVNYNELKGIPSDFDSEYKRTDDYKYFTLDKIISHFYDTSRADKQVSTIGYISRDTSFHLKTGELLLQRMYVSCCIPHAQPVSVYLIVENPESFKDNQWVKINGSVTNIKNEWGLSPAIKSQKIQLIPKPNNQYLNCDACPTHH